MHKRGSVIHFQQLKVYKDFQLNPTCDVSLSPLMKGRVSREININFFAKHSILAPDEAFLNLASTPRCD